MKIRISVILFILLAGIMIFGGCTRSTPATSPEGPAQPSVPGTVTGPSSQTETDQPLSPSERVPRITADELLQKMEQNEHMLVIDDRRDIETSYVQGHIKGAISVEFTQIISREWTPPENKDLEIIIYCS